MRIHVIEKNQNDAEFLKSNISIGMCDCFDSLNCYNTWHEFSANEKIIDQDTVLFCSASYISDSEYSDLFSDLIERRCCIILYHANCDYTIQAIKMGIYDYLLTPLLEKDLIDCFQRLKYKFKCDKSIYNIILRDAKGSQIIPLKNISYIQANGAYSRIYSCDKEYFICRTLKSLQAEIGGPFIRIHRSYMVHAGQIKCYNVNTVTLMNKQKLPVSRAGRVKLVTEIPQVILSGVG
jgi:hypothetical protein